MSIKIQNAILEDSRGLGVVHSESWKVAYKGIVPDSFLEKMTVGNSKKRFERALSQGIEKNIVAFEGDQIVGFMCIGKSRDDDSNHSVGEIWGIYVLPSHWRQGIGTELLLYGLSSLKAEEYSKVTLWVLEDNINARRFYEKHGFKYDGTKKELNLGKELNEIRYVKDLALPYSSLDSAVRLEDG